MRIVGTINLDEFDCNNYGVSRNRLRQQLRHLYKDYFEPDEKIIVLHQQDCYVQDSNVGLGLKNLRILLNEENITNCFVRIHTTNKNIQFELEAMKDLNQDTTQVEYQIIDGEYRHKKIDIYPSGQEEYEYGSVNPIKVTLDSLAPRHRFLLSESKTFCMYPWIHLHAWPTGQTFPCCHAEMGVGQVGNSRIHTLAEIWNSTEQKQLRKDMLSETPNLACGRCYEQEKSGFFSGRKSANKHNGHHVSKVDETQDNGHFDKFEMTYWDIRFSNLCNLRCRSCGHIFSSQWYQDQAKLAGPEWKARNTVLNYAGRTETDMWEQLEPHLEYVEQIYFAGGEPLLMEEHYNILEKLVQLKRFDVRLIYNTNFTHTNLKGRSVFEYWRQFDSVAVGASLDGMGSAAEYIRKGTAWNDVVQNRQEMIRVCPNVDFYISPTLSILNAWHLPDFHKEWVSAGLIKGQDLNVNILQDPAFYRIDIAPAEYKQRLSTKYLNHLMWLCDRDPLGRATQGFESAIAFMNATDNTQLIDTFWRKTHELDSIRNENILDVLPELRALK